MKKILITIAIILTLTITGCSSQEYEVNIEVVPEDSGEVVGEEIYEEGEEVELAVIPNEGYEFENWTVDEEVISEDKIHKMTIEEELNLTANLDRIVRNKFAYVNINDGVDVRIGPFYEGEEVSLKAETIEGYEFLNWEIDGEKFSEEKKIEFNVDKRDIKVKAIESEYLVNPEGITWLFNEIKLIEGKVYAAGGKDEVGMPTKPFELLEKLDSKEIDVSQDRVIISIERPSADTLIGLYNDGGSPYIESCDIVFEINRYEDGSFKIKDYYIENMITFEE